MNINDNFINFHTTQEMSKLSHRPIPERRAHMRLKFIMIIFFIEQRLLYHQVFVGLFV